MDSCREVLQVLTEYLEGDMSPQEKAQFEGHLQACPPCRAFLRTYQKADELCRAALREVDIPEELQQRVRAFLRIRMGFARGGERP